MAGLVRIGTTRQNKKTRPIPDEVEDDRGYLPIRAKLGRLTDAEAEALDAAVARMGHRNPSPDDVLSDVFDFRRSLWAARAVLVLASGLQAANKGIQVGSTLRVIRANLSTWKLWAIRRDVSAAEVAQKLGVRPSEVSGYFTGLGFGMNARRGFANAPCRKCGALHVAIRNLDETRLCWNCRAHWHEASAVGVELGHFLERQPEMRADVGRFTEYAIGRGF